MQRLYIANKNYSSWSMRAWLVLTAFNIDFGWCFKKYADIK